MGSWKCSYWTKWRSEGNNFLAVSSWAGELRYLYEKNLQLSAIIFSTHFWVICNLSLQYYLHNCTIQVLNCSWQRRLSELVSRDRVRFLHSGHLFCKWHCYRLKIVIAFHQNCFTNTVVLLGVFNKPSKMQRISDNRTKKKNKTSASRNFDTVRPRTKLKFFDTLQMLRK